MNEWLVKLAPRDRLGDVLAGVVVVLILSLALLWTAPARTLILLFALGFFTAGFLVGFIFGIPKSAAQAPDASSVQAPTRRRVLLPNTNLDQISDWLTKTIVGLGLVELNKIPGAVRDLSAYLAAQAGSPALAAGYCTAVVIEFPIVGFLGGYLVTRLVISRLIGDVETALATSPDDQDQLRRATAGLLTPADASDARTLVTPAAKKAAVDVADRQLEELTNVNDIRAWARAKLVLDDFKAAIRGFRLATQLDPADVRTRVELVTALDNSTDRKVGVVSEMLRNLEAAKAHIDDNTPDALRTAVYEYLVYANLFVFPPKGFEDAIRNGEEFVRTKLGEQSAVTWVNLAAGYGQRYAWGLKHDATPDDLKRTRDAALDAARRAIEMDQGNREILRRLLVKAYPGKRKDEDDLEALEVDAAFRSLIIGSDA